MSILNPTNIRTQTCLARAQLASETAAPAPAKALSSKEQAIYDAVKSGSWGCQKASVHALVAAITGVNVPHDGEPDEPSHKFTIGAVYMFHGKPVIVRRIDGDGDARFVTADLVEDVGGDSYIECGKLDEITVASEAEVDALLTLMGMIPATA